MYNDKVSDLIDAVLQDTKQSTSYVDIISEPLTSAQKVNLLIQGHLDTVTETTEDAAQTIIERVVTVDDIITTLATQLQAAIDESESVKREGFQAIASLQASLDEMGNFVKQREHDAQEHELSIQEILRETKNLSSLTDEMDMMSVRGSCLALNAATQAASAGEQGRGFRVVAEEVRNMARTFKKMSQSIDASAQQVIDKVLGDNAVVMDQESIASDVQRLASFTAQLEDIIKLFQRYNVMNSSAFGNISGSAQQAGTSIMDMMASIQFQDITRQQIGTVKDALSQINTHFDSAFHALHDPSNSTQPEPLKLDSMFGGYVMEKQRQTHHAIMGEQQPLEDDVQNDSIELF